MLTRAHESTPLACDPLPRRGPVRLVFGAGPLFLCSRNHSLERAQVINLCDEPPKERRQVEEVGLATTHLSSEQILAFQ